MFNEEMHIQTAFVHWLRVQHPDVLFTISPVGAMRLPIRIGAAYKRMGYLKGTPDVMVFEIKGGYPGLFIEFKTKKGSLSKEQKWVMSELDRRGYKVCVCRSVDEAIMAIENYLINP